MNQILMFLNIAAGLYFAFGFLLLVCPETRKDFVPKDGAVLGWALSIIWIIAAIVT